MTCDRCGEDPVWIARIRRGRAMYFCVPCMNAEMDAGWHKGDEWIARNRDDALGASE